MKDEKQLRKSIWMAKATAHFDSPQIRKEAEEIFEKKWKESYGSERKDIKSV